MSGRALDVARAHVVHRVEEEPPLALALAVAERRALLRHHLVDPAHPAAQTLPDVVPQLRERAGRTRRALTRLRRRAVRAQVEPRLAAAAFHRFARHKVFALVGERVVDAVAMKVRGHQKQEQNCKHLRDGEENVRGMRGAGASGKSARSARSCKLQVSTYHDDRACWSTKLISSQL